MKEVIYRRIVARCLKDSEGNSAVVVAITREVNFILVFIDDAGSRSRQATTSIIANFRTHEQNRAIEWAFSPDGVAAIERAIAKIKP